MASFRSEHPHWLHSAHHSLPTLTPVNRRFLACLIFVNSGAQRRANEFIYSHSNLRSGPRLARLLRLYHRDRPGVAPVGISWAQIIWGGGRMAEAVERLSVRIFEQSAVLDWKPG